MCVFGQKKKKKKPIEAPTSTGKCELITMMYYSSHNFSFLLLLPPSLQAHPSWSPRRFKHQLIKRAKSFSSSCGSGVEDEESRAAAAAAEASPRRSSLSPREVKCNQDEPKTKWPRIELEEGEHLTAARQEENSQQQGDKEQIKLLRTLRR